MEKELLRQKIYVDIGGTILLGLFIVFLYFSLVKDNSIYLWMLGIFSISLIVTAFVRVRLSGRVGRKTAEGFWSSVVIFIFIYIPLFPIDLIMLLVTFFRREKDEDVYLNDNKQAP